MLARLPTAARRASLLSLILLALVAPGTAQADTFEFNILRNSCKTTGGDFHHGEVLLKVKVKENGASGANNFTLTAAGQHFKNSTNSWVLESQFETVKVTFPDDANSYYHTRWFAYDPKDASKHRVVVVIKVRHNNTVLQSKALVSKAC